MGLYALYGRDFTRPSSPVVSHKDVACDFVLTRSRKNQCSSYFFDFSMTIECAACS